MSNVTVHCQSLAVSLSGRDMNGQTPESNRHERLKSAIKDQPGCIHLSCHFFKVDPEIYSGQGRQTDTYRETRERHTETWATRNPSSAETGSLSSRVTLVVKLLRFLTVSSGRQ